MKKLFAIFFILLFSFCSKKESHSQYPNIIGPDIENPVQVNTKTMLHMCMDNGYRDLAYNISTDTAALLKRENNIPENYLTTMKFETILPRYDFRIIIDTSYTISGKGFEYKSIPIPDDFWMRNGLIKGKAPTSDQIKRSSEIINSFYDNIFKLPKTFVECYPLLIYNNSKKTAYTYHIKLIQEAKDIDGKWKPIEFFSDAPSCLPSPFFHKHLPQKYNVVSIIKYHGNFKTKLRVKVKMGKHIYYSNEIVGQINRTQFDRSYAKNTIIWTWRNGSSYLIDEYLSLVFLKDQQ
ncbi:hypothetical protein [Flavobacterium sangjuense]|uniref:Uncharacterized protein n=1 Tax=Flavobacterium sangjuense TaxID=2518177 RepID=A0A4P7PU73_9FLAO|nr:hypothetical protein [Flavobacterium sangjuense]QBZ97413.1 hypothetical protein GS03_00902 [Flavobacterium sangjuense]